MNTPVAGRPHWAYLCLFLLVSLVASGCSGADQPVDEPVAAVSAGRTVAISAPEVVTTRSGYGKVYGHLPRATRKSLRRQVTKVVDDWWEAAFLGGSYPRTTFRASFPAFAKGARERARRDGMLMSNRDIGARVESITPRHRQVTIDAVAVGGHARGVTARFTLRFRATGHRQQVVVVQGRLFLHHRPGGWQVFGYDVRKWSRA